MSAINELKQVLHISDTVKQIGVVTEVKPGSVLLRDFQDRVFSALLESDRTIVVGQSVIVTNGVVVGRTEVEGAPTVYEV